MRLTAEFFEVREAPGSAWVALRAGATVLLALTVLGSLDRLELSAYATFGAFALVHGGPVSSMQRLASAGAPCCPVHCRRGHGRRRADLRMPGGGYWCRWQACGRWAPAGCPCGSSGGLRGRSSSSSPQQPAVPYRRRPAPPHPTCRHRPPTRGFRGGGSARLGAWALRCRGRCRVSPGGAAARPWALSGEGAVGGAVGAAVGWGVPCVVGGLVAGV